MAEVVVRIRAISDTAVFVDDIAMIVSQDKGGFGKQPKGDDECVAR